MSELHHIPRIVILTDFISHVDGEPCKDITCPCHIEPSIEVALSDQISARYDRVERAVTFYSWYAGRFELTAEETYRLLALLHAEMPAEGGV